LKSTDAAERLMFRH